MNVIFVLLLIFAACFMSFAQGPAASIPTRRIKKGKESLIVNLQDAAAWIKKGWKRVDDVPSPDADAVTADNSNGDDAEDGNAELVNACKSHAELDALIEENGLEIEDGLTIPDKKTAILEAIKD